MNIKIKKLSSTAKIPTKAHDTDACFDIYADLRRGKTEEEDYDYSVVIHPGSYQLIPTGISTEIPIGYFAPIFCRSGMGINRHLRLSNSVGIIDSDYRGEWMVSLHNDGNLIQEIHHGNRIAQFTILPVLDVTLEEKEELNETIRDKSGFGSTGS